MDESLAKPLVHSGIILSFFAVLLAFSSTKSLATTIVYGIDIPGLHQKDGGGVYDKIVVKALVDESEAKLVVLPPGRANMVFSQCDNCCLSPSNTNPEFHNFKGAVVQTKAMDVAKVYIFAKPNSANIPSLSELSGKVVGGRIGMPYGAKVDSSGIILDRVASIETNIKKLELGRIEAMIAYVPDAYTAFSNLGKTPFAHSVDQPLVTHEDSLVCRNAPQSLIEHLNKYIQSLTNDGAEP